MSLIGTHSEMGKTLSS